MSTSTTTTAPSTTPTPSPRTWTRDGFLISTDASLLSIPALCAAFASDELYWAKPLPADAMEQLVRNSLCFGLYTPTPELPPVSETVTTTETAIADEEAIDSTADAEEAAASTAPASQLSSSSSSPTPQIGFARLITDHVTFAYLTDVYILPAWQGQGLGKWLVGCVQEVLEGWPHLRRSMLATGKEGPAVGFYGREMKMQSVGQGLEILSWVGPGWPGEGN